jgi:hypothetical protein
VPRLLFSGLIGQVTLDFTLEDDGDVLHGIGAGGVVFSIR